MVKLLLVFVAAAVPVAAVVGFRAGVSSERRASAEFNRALLDEVAVVSSLIRGRSK